MTLDLFCGFDITALTGGRHLRPPWQSARLNETEAWSEQMRISAHSLEISNYGGQAIYGAMDLS